MDRQTDRGTERVQQELLRGTDGQTDRGTERVEQELLRGTDGQTDRGTERVQQELCREDKAWTLTAVTMLSSPTVSLLQSPSPRRPNLRTACVLRNIPRHLPRSVTLQQRHDVFHIMNLQVQIQNGINLTLCKLSGIAHWWQRRTLYVVCVCVCVCVRERERVCVCVCERERVCV